MRRRATTRAARSIRAEQNAIKKIDKLTAQPGILIGGARQFEWDGEFVTAVEWLRRFKSKGTDATRTVSLVSTLPAPPVADGPIADTAGTTMGEMPFRTVDFGTALALLKSGRRVQRSGWNGPGQYIELQRPDENSKMNLPYLFIRTVQGQLVPWLASQTDLLAEDWRLVD